MNPKVNPVAEDIMTKNLITLKANDKIDTAIELFIKNEISGAPVVNDQGNLIGILSEKDCLRLVLDNVYHKTPNGSVAQYMTEVKQTVNAKTDIITIVGIIVNNPFRRLPVLDGAKLIGQISRRDVLKVIKEMGSWPSNY